MSQEKQTGNQQIVYMRDVLGMSFLSIAMSQTLAGRKLTESRVSRIYNREKKKAAQQSQEAEHHEN